METIILTKEHRGGVKSTTFSGRPEGQSVRQVLGLNDYDNKPESVIVKIPNDTTSFNPSFFLGLFFESVKKCGSVEAFKQKYILDLSDFTEELRGYIMQDYEDCLRRCNNELNKKTGLDL